MSALTRATLDLMGNGPETYDRMIAKLAVNVSKEKRVRFDDIDKSMIKDESTKTPKDYCNIKLSDDVADRLCIKFLDPLNVFTIELDNYEDVSKLVRKSDCVMVFDYPVVSDNAIFTVPVLFKVEAKSNRVLKFSEEEKKELIGITQTIYSGVSLILLRKDLVDINKDLSTMKSMVETGMVRLNLDSPIPDDATVSELLDNIKDANDYSVYIATEGDGFFMPHLFCDKIAKVLGLKIDLHLADSLAYINSLESSNVEEGLAGNIQSLSVTESVVEYTEGVFGGVSVKYARPIPKAPIRSDFFVPLSAIEYFETHGNTSNRIANMNIDFTAYSDSKSNIPCEVEVVLGDADPSSVADFCQIFSATRGMRLVKDIVLFFDCATEVCGRFLRYDIDHIEYVLATLYRAVLSMKKKTTVQRIASKNILSFFWAFRNARSLLNDVGIFKFASLDELFYALRRILPDFFDAVDSSAQIDIAAEVPVTKLPAASEFALAIDRSDAAQAVMPRVVSEPTTVQRLPSTALSGRSSLMSASLNAARSVSSKISYGSSGYGTDRFSKASSYGSNCINGHNSIVYMPVVPDFNIVQNIISTAVDLVTTNFEHVYYNNGEFHYQTWLNNPAIINDQAVRICKEDTYVRFYDAERQVRPTRIKLTAPQVDDVIPVSILDPVMTGINIDTRKWTSQLMGELRCDRKLAEHLSPLLTKHLERYNNSTIYTIGHIIEMALADFETESIVPEFGQIPEGSIVTFNTNTGIANVNTEVANMQTYLAEGRVMVRGKDLSSRDYGVMKLISAGPSSVRVAANSNDKHIVSSIICEGSVKWCVINDEDTAIPMNVGAITSAHVSAFLTKLVNMFKDSDAMVSGFIQASTILNGKIYEMRRAEQTVHRFVLSTLEIGQINLPRPRGHTWLLHAIHLEPSRCNASFFNNDLNALHGANVEVKNRVSVFVALAVTLGVSTFLDCWNITGADITSSCLPPSGGNNLGQIFDTLTAARGKVGAPLLTIACGFISQVSEIAINPNVFACRSWCDNMNAIRDLVYEPQDLWQAVWDEYIPYLVEPLSASFMLRAWPTIWHILAPEVTFEITQEVNMLGPVELRMWDASVGSEGYKSTGISKTPWVKEAYGGLVISAMRQHFNVRHDWQIIIQVFHQAGSHFVKSADTFRFQPQYDQDFGIIKIGTLVTFNWNTMRSLVPALSANTIGEGYFHMMSCVHFNNMTSAGIYLPNVQTGHAVSVGIFTDSGIKGIEIYNASSTVGSSHAASEN